MTTKGLVFTRKEIADWFRKLSRTQATMFMYDNRENNFPQELKALWNFVRKPENAELVTEKIIELSQTGRWPAIEFEMEETVFPEEVTEREKLTSSERLKKSIESLEALDLDEIIPMRRVREDEPEPQIEEIPMEEIHEEHVPMEVYMNELQEEETYPQEPAEEPEEEIPLLVELPKEPSRISRWASSVISKTQDVRSSDAAANLGEKARTAGKWIASDGIMHLGDAGIWLVTEFVPDFFRAMYGVLEGIVYLVKEALHIADDVIKKREEKAKKKEEEAKEKDKEKDKEKEKEKTKGGLTRWPIWFFIVVISGCGCISAILW